ncbi:ABC transporter permease [Clostridium sp. Marseille-Q2269]|uniref:ABC transporter permease n=1 Tax=Clostridium sp. Marseille-Q2269 TaxID=2942205 RepID=UPI002074504B|nr:ABC transporter permease [Clostridium sp. Marseille-Q2269]
MLEKFLNIITLDIRKKGYFRSVIIPLVSIICILFFSCTLIKENITIIPRILLTIIPYIILANYSFSLTQEFTNKTDKIIFTGIFSRNDIIISKLISFVVISVVCFVVYEIISIICNTFRFQILFNTLCSFIIYGFTLGAFILLVSVLTSNSIITGIVTYIFYFDLIILLFNQVLASNINKGIKNIIENSPSYIANTGFYVGKYNMNQSIVMITFGIIFLILSCVIINTKNM